jgi:hypothetical protein
MPTDRPEITRTYATQPGVTIIRMHHKDAPRVSPRRYGQCKGTGRVPTIFLRHYCNIHQLLDVEAVQKFIGTQEYLEHNLRKRFKSLNPNLAGSGTCAIEDEKTRKQFEADDQLS